MTSVFKTGTINYSIPDAIMSMTSYYISAPISENLTIDFPYNAFFNSYIVGSLSS